MDMLDQKDENLAFESNDWTSAPKVVSKLANEIMHPIISEKLRNIGICPVKSKLGFGCELKMSPDFEMIRMDIVVGMLESDWEESAVMFIPTASLDSEEYLAKSMDDASNHLCANVKKFIEGKRS